MGATERIHEILSETSASLTSLIKTAVQDGRFGDVAEIAAVAESIERLKKGGNVATRNPAKRRNADAASTSPIRRSRSSSKRLARKYPRFERDDDKLVKVGWSKKNRATYEHRAPIRSVYDFVRQLSNVVDTGSLFRIENLMPVIEADTGDEIPAYQVYLALAWLRDIHVVKKKGRDGYVLDSPSPLEAVESNWNQMELES